MARRRALGDASLTRDVCDAGIDLAGEDAPSDPVTVLRSWEDDEQMEQARRILRQSAVASQRSERENPRHRFDPPSSQALRVHLQPQHQAASIPASAPRAVYAPTVESLSAAAMNLPSASASGSALAGLAWTIVSLGTMGLVCGGVLIGWSLATARGELWNFGLPIAVIGQGILLLGLMLALLARRSGRSYAMPGDQQLAPRMQQLPVGYPASVYGPSSPAAAQAILNELRGQLDAIAAQLHSPVQSAARPWG